jgi:hypothetical protein
VFLAGLIGTEVTVLSDFADITLINQAAAAGLVALVTFVQNWLEETKTVGYPRG